MMRLPEVTPGWGSMSGHHRWRVPYRQLPELMGQTCIELMETERQDTTACVLLEVMGGSGSRRATCFPVVGKSPWSSLAADVHVNSLQRDLFLSSLGLALAGLQLHSPLA